MDDFGEDTLTSCAALSGEKAADCEDEFTALVRRQSQFVFRVAFSVVRNVQDAEDVVQETFLKIYRLGAWTDMQDERAFLARTAWRAAVGRIRRVAGRPLKEEAVNGAPSAEANLIRADSEAVLHRLVDALPLELRLPLALSTVDGMTSPEIAKVMGIPEGTVRGRLLRARGILKRKLQEAEVRRG
jgi:RNA polymerase sigma-70 factor (ECF subfamily)